MLRPFQEAVDYQRDRVAMPRSSYDELSAEAALRAFTIAGLTRQDALETAHQLATRAIEEGLTHGEFLDLLGDLLDSQDGVIFSPQRLELIAQNNTAIAYSAGRYRQLQDPELLALRPYLQYPLGPNDSRTSRICLALEGFVARADHPVWQHISPPNHHNERHIQVLSLTEEQARETGKIYEGSDEDLYPFAGGQRIMPDPGFDFSPHLLTADDRALVEAAQKIGRILPAETAADYGLQAFADVGRSTLPTAPRRVGRAIKDISDDAEYEKAWQLFRKTLGFHDDINETIIVDLFGDGNRVTRGTFEHIMGLDKPATKHRKADRPQFFAWIRPTLQDPFEAWIVPREGPDGKPVMTRRFFGLYDTGTKTHGYNIFVDLSPGGWLMDSGFIRELDVMESLRQGRMIFTKAGRRR